MAPRIKGTVDFAIITIKEEEFEAVLRRFPTTSSASGLWEYNVSDLPTPGADGESCRVVTVRTLKQATSEAQSLTSYLIEDLDPRWILLVGIAGAVPAAEYTLGDVVVSTRIYDLNVGALIPGQEHHYAITSDSIHEDVAPHVANLGAHKSALGAWSSELSVGRARPSVDLSDLERRLHGDERWRHKIRSSLLRHFGDPTSAARPPIYTAGPIASSDDLIKDPSILQRWLTHARDIYAVEMESAGVHRGARRRGHTYPFLSLRGLSDVVGLERDHDWTMYACETAAAFTRAFIDLLAPRLAARSGARARRPLRAEPKPRSQSGATPPAELWGKVAEAPPEPLVVAHHVEARDVLEAYAHRTALEPGDAVLTVLRRLNLPWSEPLDAGEQALLAETALRPGVNYPAPDWVLEQLAEAPAFVRDAADAVRSTARWPDSYRLNYVRQLSTTNLTRALGAGHTRLAHCLGTLDVAACLLAALGRNSPEVVDFEDPQVKEWAIAAILFAFLHDRYHGPLGHSLDPLSWLLTRAPGRLLPESAFRKLDKEVLESELRAAQHRSSHPIHRLVEFVVQRISASHGALSAQGVLKRVHDLVRLGAHPAVSGAWQFFQDVVDGEVDADRLDYVWRDALHLSVPTPEVEAIGRVLRLPGGEAIGELVGSARVVLRDERRRLAFGVSHARTIDALLALRFLFYVAYYEHPDKRIYDELMTRTLRGCLRDAGCIEGGRVHSAELSHELRRLTDADLFHFLHEVSSLVGADGRPRLMRATVRMTHDLLQARPWQGIWRCDLTEAQLERELFARAAQAPLVERIAAAQAGGEVEAAKAALRTVARAGRTGELEALAAAHGVALPAGAEPTAASPVVDFWVPFRGSFEALRKAEESLWRRIAGDPELAGLLQQIRAAYCWEPEAELPRLLVMGMVRAVAPSVGRVLLDHEDRGADLEGWESPWAQLIGQQTVLESFVAVHPRLLPAAAQIREHVDRWFGELGYLDL